MEATFPTEAIILDRNFFREYDSRIAVYSPEYGKMDLVVRGTRRPKSKLSGHIEPISVTSLMVVKGKQYDYIGSARGLNAFSNLKNNFELLILSGKAIKIFKKLVEPEEVDPALYALLKNFLYSINKKDLEENTGLMNYYAFIYKFISMLGYRPELAKCSECKKLNSSNDYFFNFVNGGLICRDCAKGQKNNLLISEKTVKVLNKFEILDSFDILGEDNDPVTISELKKVLGMYVKYNLDFVI